MRRMGYVVSMQAIYTGSLATFLPLLPLLVLGQNAGFGARVPAGSDTMRNPSQTSRIFPPMTDGSTRYRLNRFHHIQQIDLTRSLNRAPGGMNG